MSVRITAEAGGSRLAVRAVPRSQPTGLAGERDGRLLVRLGAAPVDGEANRALLALLAKLLDLPKSRLRLAAGERARDKDIVIDGVAPEAIAARLTALLAAAQKETT
jgi:uncharacterized protein YggU (UPF0235/DUF167 family)